MPLWFGKSKKHKLEVQRTHSCAIPEGLLINGFIQDEEAFAQWAKTMVSELGLKGKGVTVIADSTAVIYRQIETPKLKAKALEKESLFQFSPSDRQHYRKYRRLRHFAAGGKTAAKV